jgi:hypothetical protein
MCCKFYLPRLYKNPGSATGLTYMPMHMIQIFTSLSRQHNVLHRASTNYEHSIVAPTNYEHHILPGPNQLWAPKVNDSKPIMSSQKEMTSHNQLWTLKTSGLNQLWASCDYKCMYVITD